MRESGTSARGKRAEVEAPARRTQDEPGRASGEGWRIYLDRRLFVIAFLGFAAGLPYLLSSATLAARLQTAGVEIVTIGFFGWVGLAYSFKVLWAPVVDRVALPLLGRLLGRRRSWMILAQGAVIAALAGLALSEPAASIGWTAALAAVLAFSSATQDIVVDAYRIEAVEQGLLGASAANYVVGYRLALLVSGGGALIFADVRDWTWAYMAMAALMLVGVATVLVAGEPRVGPRSGAASDAARVARFVASRAHWGPRLRAALGWFYGAVACPMIDFAGRPGWVVILLFVALFKLTDQMLGPIANPFYLEMGFSLTEIGLVSKFYGLAMTLTGALLGGLMVARWGFFPSLLVTGVLQAASNLMFALLAVVGYSMPMLIATITVENLSGGLVTAAFLGYLSALCNVAYTATQYALLSSLMNLVPGVLKGWSGWLVAKLGWSPFFVMTTGLALPGMAVLIWMMRTYPAPGSAPEPG